MDAHEYLSQIAKLDLMISHKLEQAERWRYAARGLGGLGGSGERVQTSAGVYGREPDAVCRYVDLEREIKDLERKRAAIIRCIEQLPSIECDIIFKLYVGKYDEKRQIFVPFTRKEVAYQYGKSCDWVKQKKKKALRMVQSLIDSEEL